MDRPFGLLAELTYACPLHCPYCSNPLNMADYWRRADHRGMAAGAGRGPATWACCSSTCPAVSRCCAATSSEIVAAASELGLYTNLITSGLGLSRAPRRGAAGRRPRSRADQHPGRRAGPVRPDRGHPVLRAQDRRPPGMVKELGWPLTLNVVLHRQNIDRVADILGLAEELGADRIELANTQYYGWALRNRDALLPSRAQLERGRGRGRAARERLRGRMEIIYVLPDYYSRYPKPCMGGWGRRQLTVAPNGDVLPCPTAHDAAAASRQRARACPGLDLGASRRVFQRFRARTGCRIPAGAATAASSTSAGAAARRSSSPATPPAPIRSATCPPTTRSWPPRCGRPMARLCHPGRPPPRRRRAPSSFPGRSRVPGRSLAPVRHDGPRYPWRRGKPQATASGLLRRAPLVDGHNDLAWQLRQRFGRDSGRLDGAGTPRPHG